MFYNAYFGNQYILIIIGAIICLAASGILRATYSKYSKIRSASGMTGRDAAARILNSMGIYDVRIEHTSGNLTDHYDPRAKVLRLSDATYQSSSVAAVGVAAHECGHAIQHARGYAPLNFRSALVPIANIGSTLAWPLIVIGLFYSSRSSSILLNIGILAFSLSVLFQLVTLPVEFNASSRAVQILGESGMLQTEELTMTKKVLSAAALTYVASAAASILQLLRLVLLSGSRSRRN